MSRTTTPRPADLGPTLRVRAAQEADRVRVTTEHGGMIFTTRMDATQARDLAMQLMRASERADKAGAAPTSSSSTTEGGDA